MNNYDPIVKKPWDSKVKMINNSLGSILFSIGLDARKGEWLTTDILPNVRVQELNWNPTIKDESDKDIPYQRAFVWSLDDKKLLIESIYNNIDIGKIVVRNRSFDWVLDRYESGYKLEDIAFKDIIDGKQRLNALVEFVTNVYPDSAGHYWSEFSDQAQRKFLQFNSISYGELGENASDADAKEIFLTLNFTGVQMSQDHIDYVKSIKL